jgi:hypothetical protein
MMRVKGDDKDYKVYDASKVAETFAMTTSTDAKI